MNEQGIEASFKAYDIRGRVPGELDEEFAGALGLAIAAEFGPKRVVIGRDVRHSGPALTGALAKSLMNSGIDVVDTGICGTEEIYFATATQGFDLGMVLTASHNPAEYNGLKMVKAGAVPVSSDSGLFSLRDRILNGSYREPSNKPGNFEEKSFREDYLSFLKSSIKAPARLKIVMNPGNGCAGYILDKLLQYIPGEFIIINGEPDGSFPNGVPNPLLPERRHDTASAVIEHGADLGLAWDGDFDRCFFFDHNGNFIESYYLIGLFAQSMLKANPGSKIVYDTRLYWNTLELVRAAGGVPVANKTGHAFMKERLRREEAVYGGEMSAHHYFKDFYYCDSGMLPWLRLLEIMGESGKSLAELVEERSAAYPCSGEINFRVKDARSMVEGIHSLFSKEINNENYIDGLDADCGNWRFNLRTSNTEPLLRLNVESRGDAKLMKEKTMMIEDFIRENGGEKASG